jgi:hypothetical protein
MSTANKNEIKAQATGSPEQEASDKKKCTCQHGDVGNSEKVLGAADKDVSKDEKTRIWHYSLTIVTFLLFSVLLAIVYFKGGFDDALNFTSQKWVFAAAALFGLVGGLNIGYMNPTEKHFWAITDMIWLTMAVVSLSALLSPVENVLLKGDIRTAANVSEQKRKQIADDISNAKKLLCASRIYLQQCKDWKQFSDEVSASGSDPGAVYGRANQFALPKLPHSPLYEANRKEIESTLRDLGKSLERERNLQSRLDDVGIGWIYGRAALLMIAIFLRAGKTGAELRNNPPKTLWKQKATNFLERLGFNPR